MELLRRATSDRQVSSSACSSTSQRCRGLDGAVGRPTFTDTACNRSRQDAIPAAMQVHTTGVDWAPPGSFDRLPRNLGDV